MSDMELRELLAVVEAAGNECREETQRLIEYVEKVALEIAKVAEKSNIEADIMVEINEEGWEDTQVLAVRPLGWRRGVWAVVLENEYNGKVFCVMATKPEGLILHDMPRRAWVAVAKSMVALAQALKVNAERAARETKEAANLAEKLANALSQGC